MKEFSSNLCWFGSTLDFTQGVRFRGWHNVVDTATWDLQCGIADPSTGVRPPVNLLGSAFRNDVLSQ
jgi:hypothetical protein